MNNQHQHHEVLRAETVARMVFGNTHPIAHSFADTESALGMLAGARLMTTDPDAEALLVWYEDTLSDLRRAWISADFSPPPSHRSRVRESGGGLRSTQVSAAGA
jgi:hypothetical protein